MGLERVTGIEPALSAWEAEVLPLNYTRERRPAAMAIGEQAYPVLCHAVKIALAPRWSLAWTSWHDEN